MRIINLTPHAIVLVAEDENGDFRGLTGEPSLCKRFRLVAKLPSEGVARVATRTEPHSRIEMSGVPFIIMKTIFGRVEHLPDPMDDTLYVVSLATANAAKIEGRPSDDLLIPGNVVRNPLGEVIGITSFGQI